MYAPGRTRSTYCSFHLPMPDPSPSNDDSLKFRLLTARKKEWWPATAHSGQFTPGGYLSTVIHTTSAGIEPTAFRLLVRRAISRATETKKEKKKITSNSDCNEENNTDVIMPKFSRTIPRHRMA